MYGQPNYNQFFPNPVQQMPQMSFMPQAIVKVTGMDGARAYMVAPNSSVALFDDARDVFYLKTTDAGGYPTIRTFEFTEVRDGATDARYVTREEFDELKRALYGRADSDTAAAPAK